MSRPIRELVAAASRVLGHADQGDLIWGHVSARDPAGRGVWIKAAGCALEEVTADTVHLVDLSGRVVQGLGTAHNEIPIHTEIMAARSDVGAVVHTHAPHALALAATGQSLRPVSHAANFFVPPEVPRFTDSADLITTPDLGKQVAKALGAAKALFLVNHGLVAVGQDVQSATVAAVLLERAAQQQLLTHSFGGWPTWSPELESLSKRNNVYSRSAILAVWDYLVRTLPDTTPAEDPANDVISAGE